jgi:hypothetical protein
MHGKQRFVRKPAKTVTDQSLRCSKSQPALVLLAGTIA